MGTPFCGSRRRCAADVGGRTRPCAPVEHPAGTAVLNAHRAPVVVSTKSPVRFPPLPSGAGHATAVIRPCAAFVVLAEPPGFLCSLLASN